MTTESKLVKFQVSAPDFHLGDGSIAYGPREVDGEEVDGDIVEIDHDLAELCQKRKQGKILK